MASADVAARRAAGIAAGLRRFYRRPAGRRCAFILGCAAIAAFSLGLRAAYPVLALPGAAEDDALFVRLASSLRAGRWLGVFDNLTLVKGMFYPLFIAAASLVHVPLKLAEQAVYLGGCFVVALLLRGGRSRTLWFPLLMFLVLALDPIMWSIELARVIREGLYVGLTLALVALSVAISLDPAAEAAGSDPAPPALSRWRSAGAGAATGLLAAAFWLTREEGIWIVPAIGVVLLAAGTGAVSGPGRARRVLPGLAVRWAAAAAAFAMVVLSVEATNRAHYGAFETTEVQSLPFRRAYGALGGIAQDRWRRFVVFPKDARDRAYAVSPAARELAPVLEGPAGEAWRQAGCSESAEMDCPEILAGWFQWALRDAVAHAGHYGSAGGAARYYDALADQIEAACGRGDLSCLPPRASLAPPFRWSYLGDMARTLPGMLGILFDFAFDPDPDGPTPASEGEAGDLVAMSRVVGPIWPAAEPSGALAGWITSPAALPTLGIEPAPGSRADVAVEVRAAPDVAASFPDRRSERFAAAGAGLDRGASLVVTTAGASDAFPLAALTAGTRIDRRDYVMHIDAGLAGGPQSALPRWRRVAMAAARGIAPIYVWTIRPAFAAAILGFGLAWVWRSHERPRPTLLLLALASATALCSRLALVAYLDVTAIPSANNLYPSPASPFLLLFVGLGCQFGARAALARRAARRRAA